MARTVCSNQDYLESEEKHLIKSLNRCKYPKWALNRVKIKSQTAQKKNKPNSKKPASNNNKGPKAHSGTLPSRAERDSHHSITSKYSVIGTLYHRARTVCSNQDYLESEEKHLIKSLNRCKYPKWALNRVKIKSQTAQKKNKPNSKKPASNNNKGPKTHSGTLPSRAERELQENL